MICLKEGDRAPHFAGIDQDGNTVILEHFIGNMIILFFYPKDGTTGCTAEVCNLRDNYKTWRDKGFKIMGISTDNSESHRNFIKEYCLPFTLIADTDKRIVKKYGVREIIDKNGVKTEHTLRTTFVISKGGFIEKIIADVDTHNHSRQIESMLRYIPDF